MMSVVIGQINDTISHQSLGSGDPGDVNILGLIENSDNQQEWRRLSRDQVVAGSFLLSSKAQNRHQ